MFYGNGGMPSAWAWHLRMDQMDQMDKLGAPRYTPRVCGAQFGMARGRFTVGVCRAFLMATAVCRLRGRGACEWTRWTRWTKWTNWVRLGIPRGFAERSLVWLGGRFTVGGVPGNVMATAVCVLRGRGACIRRIRLIRLIFNDKGAPLYTPRVCGAAVWYGLDVDLPMGCAWLFL